MILLPVLLMLASTLPLIVLQLGVCALCSGSAAAICWGRSRAAAVQAAAGHYYRRCYGAPVACAAACLGALRTCRDARRQHLGAPASGRTFLVQCLGLTQ